MNTNTNKSLGLSDYGVVTRTGNEIREAKIQPIQPIVEGLLNPGTTLLAAAPKTGKSLFANQLARCLTRGEEFLGRPTATGPVLYIDLENSDHTQATRIQATTHDLTDLRVTNGNNLPKLGCGLEEALDTDISKFNYRMVVIDTLERVIPTDARRGNYSDDAKLLEKLVAVANKHPETSILLIHHARETAGSDLLDSMYGTRGLTATVSAGIVLRRMPDLLGYEGEPTHTISAVSRDLPDTDAEPLRQESVEFFVVENAACDSPMSLTDFIVEEMKHNGQPMRACQVASATGQKAGSVRKTLMRLHEADRINKVGALYSLPGRPTDPNGPDDDNPDEHIAEELPGMSSEALEHGPGEISA